MGKKNRSKQSDEDYFASLGAPTAAPTEEEEDEEVVYQRELAKAQAKEDARAKKEAEKLKRDAETAANAERARLMMEKRGKKKKGLVEEEEDEDLEPVHAEAAAAGVGAPAEVAPSAEVALAALSLLGKVLLFLRPYSPDAGAGAAGGALAPVFALFWSLVSRFASPETLDSVDATMRLTNAGAAEAIDAEDERKRSKMLFCPATGAWFARDYKQMGNEAIRRNDDGHLERWMKNLKTKSKDYGSWTKVKEGDGWASCPKKLTTRDEDLADADVKFFAVYDDKPFECTEWVGSHLCSGAAARELAVVDGPKPLFTVAYDDQNGLIATMQRKMLDLLSRKSGGEVSNGTKKAPKEKLSRADKKAKKQAYGR